MSSPRMTALNEYDRLEASALWLPEGETQRVEVIVSMGEATLMISDMNDKTLSHWSLPAVRRMNNTSEDTAIYQPDADTNERLETTDETMIAAIARVQRAIDRATPHPGRLRAVLSTLVLLATIGLAFFWLPNALVRQAVGIVPDVTRNQIGAALLTRTQRLAGHPCETAHGTRALSRLSSRLRTDGKIVVLRSGLRQSHSLPGGITLLNRALVEDFEDPDVLAGYVLAQQQRAADEDPLASLLHFSGFQTTLKLLTSGEIPDDALDSYAETLFSHSLNSVDDADLIDRFTQANLRLSPYAYAQDITGVKTLALIEADALQQDTVRPALTDDDWVAAQGICGS